jgi:hypothetical protein
VHVVEGFTGDQGVDPVDQGDAVDLQLVERLAQSGNMGGWTYVVMPGSAEYFGTGAS